MSVRLVPAQIRAARAMLDWSMMDLAEAARVSVSDDAVAMMQDALETEGVDFLSDDGNGPGVRLRQR